MEQIGGQISVPRRVTVFIQPAVREKGRKQWEASWMPSTDVKDIQQVTVVVIPPKDVRWLVLINQLLTFICPYSQQIVQSAQRYQKMRPVLKQHSFILHIHLPESLPTTCATLNRKYKTLSKMKIQPAKLENFSCFHDLLKKHRTKQRQLKVQVAGSYQQQLK